MIEEKGACLVKKGWYWVRKLVSCGLVFVVLISLVGCGGSGGAVVPGFDGVLGTSSLNDHYCDAYRFTAHASGEVSISISTSSFTPELVVISSDSGSNYTTAPGADSLSFPAVDGTSYVLVIGAADVAGPYHVTYSPELGDFVLDNSFWGE